VTKASKALIEALETIGVRPLELTDDQWDQISQAVVNTTRQSSPEMASLASKYLDIAISDLAALHNSGELFEDVKSMAGSILAQVE